MLLSTLSTVSSFRQAWLSFVPTEKQCSGSRNPFLKLSRDMRKLRELRHMAACHGQFEAAKNSEDADICRRIIPRVSRNIPIVVREALQSMFCALEYRTPHNSR